MFPMNLKLGEAATSENLSWQFWGAEYMSALDLGICLGHAKMSPKDQNYDEQTFTSG